eukprot:Rhum_TRINITY_DN8539_c0_g1::Rhum_TRINITY_DN8539_c0_g1_i1::g.28608::m.28608
MHMSLGPPPDSGLFTSPDDTEPRSSTPEDDIPRPPPLSLGPPKHEVTVLLMTVSEADGIFSASECRLSEQAVAYVYGPQSMWITSHSVASLAPQSASKSNISSIVRKADRAKLWVSPAVLIGNSLRTPSALEAALAIKGVRRVTYAQLLQEGERLVPPPPDSSKRPKPTHPLTLQGDVSSSSEEVYSSRVVHPPPLVYAVLAESILRDAQRACVVKTALVVAKAIVVSSTESQTGDAAASLLIVDDDGPSDELCGAADDVVVRTFSQLVAWIWHGGPLHEPRSKKVSFTTRSPEVCLLTPRSVGENFPRQSTRSKKLRKTQARAHVHSQPQPQPQPQAGEHGRMDAGGEVPPPLLLAPDGDRTTGDEAASM